MAIKAGSLDKPAALSFSNVWALEGEGLKDGLLSSCSL
jgi:hypothetical protein